MSLLLLHNSSQEMDDNTVYSEAHLPPKPILGDSAEVGIRRVEEYYANGDSYVGTVRQQGSLTAKHGFGKYRFANRSSYEGEWRDGRMHGHGVFIDTGSGDRFDGQWAGGLRLYGSYFYGGIERHEYHGGFAPDGISKAGKCRIVEAGIAYDAEYEDDELQWRRAVAKDQPRSEQAVPCSDDAETAAILLRAGDGRPLSQRQLNAAKLICKRQRQHASRKTLGRDSVGGTLWLEQEMQTPGTLNHRQLRDVMRFYKR